MNRFKDGELGVMELGDRFDTVDSLRQERNKLKAELEQITEFWNAEKSLCVAHVKLTEECEKLKAERDKAINDHEDFVAGGYSIIHSLQERLESLVSVAKAAVIAYGSDTEGEAINQLGKRLAWAEARPIETNEKYETEKEISDDLVEKIRTIRSLQEDNEKLRLGQKQVSIAHNQCLLIWERERKALEGERDDLIEAGRNDYAIMKERFESVTQERDRLKADSEQLRLMWKKDREVLEQQKSEWIEKYHSTRVLPECERCSELERERDEAIGTLALSQDEYAQQVGTWKIIQRLEEERNALLARVEKLREALQKYTTGRRLDVKHPTDCDCFACNAVATDNAAAFEFFIKKD